MRSSFVRSLSASLLWVACATSVHALPVVLDTPGITPGTASSSLIHLIVTAGASGTPNGFTIEWMRATEFDALGNWPTDSADPALHSAKFFGTPTLNTSEGTTSFALGGGAAATVQIGDLFDETGVLSDDRDEMAAGTEYVFHVRANGDGSGSNGTFSLYAPSPYSLTLNSQTEDHDDDRECVHSQGYWKNHADAWPVSNLRLGNVIYTKVQLLAIWGQPAAGNGLISLAHQLMAAKLNIIVGAQAPDVVKSAVAAADALISTLIIPPIGTGSLAPSATSALNDTLEDFNEDELETECRGITSTSRTTWAKVKAMYR